MSKFNFYYLLLEFILWLSCKNKSQKLINNKSDNIIKFNQLPLVNLNNNNFKSNLSLNLTTSNELKENRFSLQILIKNHTERSFKKIKFIDQVTYSLSRNDTYRSSIKSNSK
jgi:hypothetical protein